MLTSVRTPVRWNPDSRGWESCDTSKSRMDKEALNSKRVVLSQIKVAQKGNQIVIENVGEGLVLRKRRFKIKSRTEEREIIIKKGDRRGFLDDINLLKISNIDERIRISENGRYVDEIRYRAPKETLKVYVKSIGLSVDEEGRLCLKVDLARSRTGKFVASPELDLTQDQKKVKRGLDFLFSGGGMDASMAKKGGYPLGSKIKTGRVGISDVDSLLKMLKKEYRWIVGKEEKRITVELEVPEYSRFYERISQIKRQRLKTKYANQFPNILKWTKEVDYVEEGGSEELSVKSNLNQKMKIQILVVTYEIKN
jgi:RNA binding exosome subunit